MTLHGTIRSGVVVLEGGAPLPEGTPVTVLVEPTAPILPLQGERLTEEEHRRMMEIMDRIAALPIEGSGEPFSGRDHDQALYGKP